MRVGATARTESGEGSRVRPESGQSQRPESAAANARTPLETRILSAVAGGPLSRGDLVKRLGHKGVSGAIKRTVTRLLQDEWIAYTIPEKPNSRLQQYRLTLTGERALEERFS